MLFRMEPLSANDLRIVGFIERYYHKKKDFPPVDLLEEEFPDTDFEELFDHETFLYSMSQRGIRVPRVGEVSELSEIQLAAILSIADFRDRRSQTAKLKSLKVTTTMWNGWMNEPLFKDYFLKLTESRFQDSLDIAYEGLTKSMMNGDLSSVKFYLELTGRYGPQNETQKNISTIVAQIVETIQYHVKDIDTVRAIKNDFETILSGGTPVRAVITA